MLSPPDNACDAELHQRGASEERDTISESERERARKRRERESARARACEIESVREDTARAST